MALKNHVPFDRTMKTTIDDIARLAQVGRGTVSRVLNNHPAVSDETRARVLAVIEQLNYSPNFSARHMRTESSNLVGFVTDEVTTTPYAVDMIRGAQEALWQQGKMMLVVSAGYDSETTRSSMEMLLQRRVEGLVYAAMFHRMVELPAQLMRVPVVLANCFAGDYSLPSVVPDEIAGGYNATRALLERGHRRIAFINLGDPWDGRLPPLAAAQGRLEGYRQALAESGMAFDPSLVRYTDQSPKDNSNITRAMLQLSDPPTAFFCGNDRTAMGCYSGLAAMGLRIPHDVAVVGFDNLTVVAETMYPALTTVQLPHYAMGKWAADYLMTLQDQPHPPIQYKIDCPLVLRESI
jgi:LacI family transcriptional regulator